MVSRADFLKTERQQRHKKKPLRHLVLQEMLLKYIFLFLEVKYAALMAFKEALRCLLLRPTRAVCNWKRIDDVSLSF